MSKYRIYELAKNYNTSTKVVIDLLSRHNITAKNHMSTVDEQAKTILEKSFSSIEKKQDARPQAQPEAKTEFKASTQNVNNNHNNQKTTQPSHQPERRRSDNSAIHSQRNSNYTNQNRSNYQNRPAQQGSSNVSNHRPAQQGSSNTANHRPTQQGGFNGANHRPAQQGGFNAGNHRPAQQGSANGGNQRPTPAQGSANNSNYRSNNNARPQNNRPQSDRPNSQGSQHQGNKPGYKNNRPQNHGNNKNKNNRRKNFHQPISNQPKQETVRPKSVQIGDSITVKEFASKCCSEATEIIKKLMMLGIMATINQEIDFDTASLVGSELGIQIEPLPQEEDITEIVEVEDDPATLLPRAPVVTVMGHVDHGKTSLLDAIRKTNVTSHEAGGITQHIGAHQVQYQGKRIVFLDTPGHEAFTAMRARGAQVTDVAILVVAADDGVMPQTVEAINHAKSAKVPIIVAINKMDRPGANPDRVTQQLSEHGLIPEAWGGDTIMVPVSAHKKTGLSDLLEMILLVAEVQELKANPNRPAVGTIVEAQLDKGRGPVATVLVQKGTLHIGDSIVAGTAYGKVRAMINDKGEKVKKAEPSTPVEVLGLSDVPEAGDVLNVVDEKIARAVAEKRIAKKRTEEMQANSKVSLDDLFRQIKEGELKDLNILIKADVQGSLEALKQSLLSLKNEEVRVNVIHAAVGAINESDVLLAAASNALIMGFNVRPDSNARKHAETEKIDIRTYRVIYDAINDVEAAVKGLLAPQYKENILGRVEIRKVFNIPKGIVAGSYVLEGKITNNSQVRILRDSIVVHEGKLEGLRRFKDDVKEVAAGYECGVTIEKYRDIKEGDIIEAYVMEEVKPE